MNRFALFLVCLLAATLAVASGTRAGSHKSTADLADLSSMTLLPGWMREDGWYMAAIRIDLAPGWKTYWRQPGKGGIAPDFDWSQSRNLAQVGYFWPSPQVFDAYGLRTIGYTDTFVLPVLLRPRDPGQPISARLTMDYGVCDDICVPVNSSASARFAAGPVANRQLIGQSVALRPRSGRAAGMTGAECRLTPTDDGFRLDARFDFSPPLGALDAVVVETGSATLIAADAEHRQSGSAVAVGADLTNYAEGPASASRDTLRVTLIGRTGTIDIQGCRL